MLWGGAGFAALGACLSLSSLLLGFRSVLGCPLVGRILPFSNDRKGSRLCKNVFERETYSEADWKSCICAKSTTADVPINFRFNVDARTSILTKRFYTLRARSGIPDDSISIYCCLSKAVNLNLEPLILLRGMKVASDQIELRVSRSKFMFGTVVA